MTSTYSKQTFKYFYTPTQIAIATFFGGVLTGVIMLWENFRALDDSRNANLTLVIGLSTAALLSAFVMILPDGLLTLLSSSLAIPFVCALIAKGIADGEQLSFVQITAREDCEVQSIGRVLLAIVVGMAAMYALAFGVALVLPGNY